MKPILKRGMKVETQSRLYQKRHHGGKSAPRGTIGTVVDLEGGYYQGTLVYMVATVFIDEGFCVRVNERALRPV